MFKMSRNFTDNIQASPFSFIRWVFALWGTMLHARAQHESLLSASDGLLIHIVEVQGLVMSLVALSVFTWVSSRPLEPVCTSVIFVLAWEHCHVFPLIFVCKLFPKFDSYPIFFHFAVFLVLKISSKFPPSTICCKLPTFPSPPISAQLVGHPWGCACFWGA